VYITVRLLTTELIAARVKRARIEAGFTQDEMAKLLGVALPTYRTYEPERDPRVPWTKLEDIAGLLRTTRHWLLQGDSPPSPLSGGEEDSRLLAEILEELRSLRLHFEATTDDPPPPPRLSPSLGSRPPQKRTA
jgi:transcriptional regulator with XRE-family HTH domain